jgi:hypothetical protein
MEVKLEENQVKLILMGLDALNKSGQSLQASVEILECHKILASQLVPKKEVE